MLANIVINSSLIVRDIVGHKCCGSDRRMVTSIVALLGRQDVKIFAVIA
jgi:hypothetical protein